MKSLPTKSTARGCASVCLLVLSVSSAHAVEEAGTPPSVPELHCVVLPSAVVDVASGVNGRVESVFVERGDAVQAGQIVAALESGVEKANLALAMARAELDTDIHLRKARLEFERRKLNRTDRLRSSRVVSLHEQDEAETEAKLAQWQLRQAIDDQYLASLELVRATEMLNRRSVQSPIDGVVVDRFKWPGEYVEDQPILRVARLDPLWVEVVAPVTMHGAVRKNMLAEVITETDGGEVREARVTVIDPMGDAASGTFRVRLELPNPDLAVLGGTKCKARFPAPTRFAPEVPEEKPAEAKMLAPVPTPTPSPDIVLPARSAATGELPLSRPAREQRAVQEIADSYIVLTHQLGSDDERRDLRGALQASGIRDFLVMGSGPYAGRISLGVYNGRRMAERRQAQLEARGFETEVVGRNPIDKGVQAYSGSPEATAGNTAG